MSRVFTFTCLLTLGATLVLAAAQQPDASVGIAIEHATVINVATGARWSDQTAVITGNRIRAVGASGSVSIPGGVRTIDGRGKFLIPGIWDMHVHALFNGINRTLP